MEAYKDTQSPSCGSCLNVLMYPRGPPQPATGQSGNRLAIRFQFPIQRGGLRHPFG
ncbi:hypothetical protein E6O51_14250 [Pseudothauera rhizosphaerae]|uniref:Uncharacterized protein n=1 Tax=Pseudothauera rhizosphaerae TaxID=2565932 RepID=A0A4S4APK3_9RHOO|nr:hypothetical protein E6O51_14250 [Pseudothauera rhizosphaerae]